MKKKGGPVLEFSLSASADCRIVVSPIEKHRRRLKGDQLRLDQWRKKLKAFVDAQTPTPRFPPGRETGQLKLPFDSYLNGSS
jgi:hypothetical protein